MAINQVKINNYDYQNKTGKTNTRLQAAQTSYANSVFANIAAPLTCDTFTPPPEISRILRQAPIN